MKILVVDDNIVRNRQIKSLLLEKCCITTEDISVVDSAQKAKSLMRAVYFDILVLDIMIPRRDETPSAQVGLDLLEEVTRRSTIKTPGRVLGITANINDIKSYQDKFANYFFQVVEATLYDNSWRDKLVEAVNYAFKTSIAQSTTKIQKVCFTVHGIETRGTWQKYLRCLINDHTDSVEFEEYKYGVFSIFAFFFPFLRERAVNRFYQKLKKTIENVGDKEVIIISHSFGTYIAIKGIEKYLNNIGTFRLQKLILAGSVLKSNHDFNLILNSTEATVINETGDRDIPLLVSQLLVPNTGMSGRVGFFGFNNNRFLNRYFNGGHSHYFCTKSKFMETYWLPLLDNKYQPQLVDHREDNKFQQAIELTVSFLGKFKELIYVSLLIYYLLYSIS